MVINRVSPNQITEESRFGNLVESINPFDILKTFNFVRDTAMHTEEPTIYETAKW